MEQTKQKILFLIKKISETIPDENDLKGFLGISKSLISDSLNESNSLLSKLETYNNNFETILLKREIADLFDKVISELEQEFDKIKSDSFNSILKKISKIRFLIRETYIAVADQPIRTEAEIIKAKDELQQLTAQLEALKGIYNETTNLKDSATKNFEYINFEITGIKDTAIKIVSDFEEKQKNAIESEQKVNNIIVAIEAKKIAIEEIEKNTVLWEQEINKNKEEIVLRSNEYDTLNAKFKEANFEIESSYDKIFGKKMEDGGSTKGYLQEITDLKNKVLSFIEEQENKYLAQFEQIESLLPGATSAGLAEAFQKQKESYKWPIRIWSSIFILVTAFMTAFSIYLFYHQFLNGNGLKLANQNLTQAIILLLQDLPFYIPTIWLAVFSSKQQSQFKRLQQEYAFKEINAKSFSGHKRQIEELMKDGVADKELLLQLVAQLVLITSQNPSETLDSKSHNDSPPLFKLVEKVFPSLKKNKDAE